MAIELTDEMRSALASALTDSAPVTVATAGAEGMPDIAFKGSSMVWDADHLAFWERSKGQTYRNMQENPKICLLYWNREKRQMWKFFGEAALYEAGELRDQVMAKTNELELSRDPERKGVAVVIRIDRVLQAGQVLMER